MFIEFVDPILLNEVSSRDKVKFHFAERKGKFSANLTFLSRQDAVRFAWKLLELARMEEYQRGQTAPPEG